MTFEQLEYAQEYSIDAVPELESESVRAHIKRYTGADVTSVGVNKGIAIYVAGTTDGRVLYVDNGNLAGDYE